MDDKSFIFYALTVNGHDASIYVTAEEAIDELSVRIEDCYDDDYGIEHVHGIWQLTKRLGAFEDYDDIWMKDVIEIVASMIKESMKQQEQKKQKEQEESL